MPRNMVIWVRILFLFLTYAHIIGYYNPSVIISDLVSHITYVVVLILCKCGMAYILKSNPKNLCQISADRKSPKK